MRIFLLCLLSISSFCVAQQENLEELFEKAYFLETVEKNFEEAVKIYQKIVELGDDTSVGKKAKERLARIVSNPSNKKKSKSDTAKKKILKCLGKKMTLNFSETPFSNVLRFLSETANINIMCTKKVDGTETVDLSIDRVSLGACIRLLCNLFNLDYAIAHETVIIGDKREIAKLKNKKTSAIPQGVEDRFTLDFSDAPLGEVVSFLSNTCGANIVIHSRVYAKYPKETVLSNLQVRNVNIYDILHLLCIQAGDLSLKYEDSIFIIDLDRP